MIERWSQPEVSRRPSSRCTSSWDEPAVGSPGRDARPRHRPDGEHLEPVPVHGDVQPQSLDVALRVGHRQGHGVSRLEPGPVRLRRPWSRRGHVSGSSTWRRPSSPPAARTTSTSRSQSAATTRSARVQRRPALARPRRERLSEGDRRPRSALDELVPYDNAPGSETPLREHLQRCVRYTLDRLGPHGLPLIGRADWNDCLNLNCFSETSGESFQTTENREGGVAESLFIAPPVRARVQ